MPPVQSNKIYNFQDAGNGNTRVVTDLLNLQNGTYVDILDASVTQYYLGTFVISNVQNNSFEIAKAFVADEQGCAWQLTRSRPALVNPAGETIDTLRQAVNQLSFDLGNKTALSSEISDQRDIVKALNSLVQLAEADQLKSLILSIATN
jgi:hypothetical protein